MKRQPDRFVRWQKITIDQLSFVTYLLLTFSVATIGFVLSTLLNQSFPMCPYLLWLGGLAALSHALSSAFGIVMAVNRLADFRLTKDIAYKRDSGRWVDPADERKSDARGEITWILFKAQWLSFAIATVVAFFYFALLVITKQYSASPQI